MGIIIIKHLLYPVDVMVETLGAEQFLHVQLVLVLGLVDVLHGQTNTLTTTVMDPGNIPAMLPCQHDVMKVCLAFLVFSQIIMTETGKPLGRPTIITMGIGTDVRDNIGLGLDGQQAGGGIFRARMWPHRGSHDCHHLTPVVRQGKIHQVTEAF